MTAQSFTSDEPARRPIDGTMVNDGNTAETGSVWETKPAFDGGWTAERRCRSSRCAIARYDRCGDSTRCAEAFEERGLDADVGRPHEDSRDSKPAFAASLVGSRPTRRSRTWSQTVRISDEDGRA